MKYSILIDFGSTFTKLTVVDLVSKKICCTYRTASTVQTNAAIGLCNCLDAASKVIGRGSVRDSLKLASSSAAGGLRMIVVGLTESLSITAGRNAAYGAGGKVLKFFSGLLSDHDVENIIMIDPEIIFLCGGYEGGNSEWVFRNAVSLAKNPNINVPVVYGGNSQVAEEIRRIFHQQRKICIIADNIIPTIGNLNIESSVAIVRDLFMKRITRMKGFDTVKQYVGSITMPTPAAVLQGVKLLAKGTKNQQGWGALLLIDMGGATTDVHSYAVQESLEGVHLVGAREPNIKRTVEGDMGARESCNSLLEAADIHRIQHISNLTVEAIKESCQKRLSHHEFIAVTDQELAFETAITMEAVRISTRRHAGCIFNGFAEGVQKIQKGKNLRQVKTIIGTGGPIIDSLYPKRILSEALRSKEDEWVLLPDKAEFYIDDSYIFYAAGLLAQVDPELAFYILSHNLKKLN